MSYIPTTGTGTRSPSIFARDSILCGSFDKYADTAKGKLNTGVEDGAFLTEIERWRDLAVLYGIPTKALKQAALMNADQRHRPQGDRITRQ